MPRIKKTFSNVFVVSKYMQTKSANVCIHTIPPAFFPIFGHIESPLIFTPEDYSVLWEQHDRRAFCRSQGLMAPTTSHSSSIMYILYIVQPLLPWPSSFYFHFTIVFARFPLALTTFPNNTTVVFLQSPTAYHTFQGALPLSCVGLSPEYLRAGDRGGLHRRDTSIFGMEEYIHGTT